MPIPERGSEVSDGVIPGLAAVVLHAVLPLLKYLRAGDDRAGGLIRLHGKRSAVGEVAAEENDGHLGIVLAREGGGNTALVGVVYRFKSRILIELLRVKFRPVAGVALLLGYVGDLLCGNALVHDAGDVRDDGPVGLEGNGELAEAQGKHAVRGKLLLGLRLGPAGVAHAVDSAQIVAHEGVAPDVIQLVAAVALVVLGYVLLLAHVRPAGDGAHGGGVRGDGDAAAAGAYLHAHSGDTADVLHAADGAHGVALAHDGVAASDYAADVAAALALDRAVALAADDGAELRVAGDAADVVLLAGNGAVVHAVSRDAAALKGLGDDGGVELLGDDALEVVLDLYAHLAGNAAHADVAVHAAVIDAGGDLAVGKLLGVLVGDILIDHGVSGKNVAEDIHRAVEVHVDDLHIPRELGCGIADQLVEAREVAGYAAEIAAQGAGGAVISVLALLLRLFLGLLFLLALIDLIADLVASLIRKVSADLAYLFPVLVGDVVLVAGGYVVNGIVAELILDVGGGLPGVADLFAGLVLYLAPVDLLIAALVAARLVFGQLGGLGVSIHLLGVVDSVVNVAAYIVHDIAGGGTVGVKMSHRDRDGGAEQLELVDEVAGLGNGEIRLHLSDYAADVLASAHISPVLAAVDIAGLPACDAADIVAVVLIADGAGVEAALHYAGAQPDDTAGVGHGA